jgi:hypothetical protein
MPEIRVRFAPAGRETLAAIAEEVAGGARSRMTTVGYEEEGLENTQVSRKEPRPAGRATLDAIARAITAEPAEKVDLFELVTIVVRGENLRALSTPAGRLPFVRERLLRRLPVESAADIDRVDVKPASEKGTLLLRIWCRIR